MVASPEIALRDEERGSQGVGLTALSHGYTAVGCLRCELDSYHDEDRKSEDGITST